MGVVSSIVDAVGGAVESVVDVVGGAVESVGNFVGQVVDGALKNPLKTAALVAAAFFVGPEIFAAAPADLAAAELAAGSVPGVIELASGTIVDGAVLQGGMSIPAESLASAISTSSGQVVSTYGASGLAQAMTENALANVGAVSTGILNGTSNAGLWATTKEALATAKDVVRTVQLVNAVTGQKSIVPSNSPIPDGWKIDPTFDATLYNQQPTTQGQTVTQPIVQPSTGNSITVMVAIAGLAGVIYFLGKKP